MIIYEILIVLQVKLQCTYAMIIIKSKYTVLKIFTIFFLNVISRIKAPSDFFSWVLDALT